MILVFTRPNDTPIYLVREMIVAWADKSIGTRIIDITGGFHIVKERAAQIWQVMEDGH